MKNDMPLILVFKIGVGKMPRDLAIKKINEIRKLVEPYDPDLNV